MRKGADLPKNSYITLPKGAPTGKAKQMQIPEVRARAQAAWRGHVAPVDPVVFTEGPGAELHMRFWGFQAEEDLAPRSSCSSGGNECPGVVGGGTNN